jgi:aminomethyltransferase
LELNIKFIYPEKYSDTPGTPVDAVVVDIPFKESFNANTREVVKG